MPVGLTKDAGWEIGVSRTVPHDTDTVWALLEDIPGWLGEQPDDVRSNRPHDRIRVRWHDTTVQVAIRPTKTGTSIRFHQEHLRSAKERERQREHWKGVLDRLAADLER
jgi:hypothetical protein